ncbi:hypothetical protein DICPUDRAFT_74635 [Dictyostelium purpureum]|uniref:ATP-dependent RNA helicase n=1 Tax=Dictyostelium purpureum TaxID=5786 RepID=F0Z8B6_DICPU|nr:uncharacterized protein DICPUDRAFT_74635 [Dictyostelium purpureum]EGC39807.1 hypothetical protein DICPUDRAFT_74635 [Dictyostelium purpureum]|eukprot:XP_003283674.1 hypothetical protein DICPUDRAFT_74635 [Dictyostelium purpureum]
MNLINLSKRFNKISLLNNNNNNLNKISCRLITTSTNTPISINKLNLNKSILNTINTESIHNISYLDSDLNKNYYSTSVSRKFKNLNRDKKKKEKKDFNKFGFSKEILDSIKEKEWEKPTPVQSEVIPLIFKGRNILFSSVTGSGKTAAYALPFIQILSTFKRNKLEYLKNNEFNENYQLFNKEDENDGEFKMKQKESEEEYEEYEDNEEYEEEEVQSEEEYEIEEINESEIEGLEEFKENENKPSTNENDEYFQEEEEEEEEEEFEVEDFDENGNLIKKSEEEINNIERLKRLKNRNQKKPFNEVDPIGIILLPSKELALQVSKEISDLVKNVQFGKEISSIGNLRVLTLIGGVGEKKQIETLKSGVDIIVGTPGRLVQLINQEVVSLQQVRMTVVDEFDKLFNLGFFPDIRDIFDFLPKVRSRSRPFTMQTVLTSATLNHKLDELITRFAPNHLMVDLNKDLSAPTTVKQFFYHVNYRLKSHLLLYFLRRKGKTSLKNRKVLVFARTQQRVEKLTAMLKEYKINALSIHADYSITQRNKILEMFRDEESGYNILISTDVMARGVDIDTLEAVVNLDVPHVSEDYLHRVGRVGRNGREGFSLTFVSPVKQIFKIGERTVGLDESHLIDNIERSTGITSKFTKIPGPWVENRKQLSKLNNSTNQSFSNNKNKPTKNNKYNDDNDYDDDDEDYQDYQDKKPKTQLPLDKETKYHSKQEKRAVAEILLKKNIIETYKGPQTRDGLPRVKFNPNAKIRDKKISKIVIDRKGEIFDLPQLTDFKEGQYHEVVNSFDRKRAIKRGIKLPQNQTHVFLPSKIETKRSTKNIEKNPNRYNKKPDSNLYNVKSDN